MSCIQSSINRSSGTKQPDRGSRRNFEPTGSSQRGTSTSLFLSFPMRRHLYGLRRHMQELAVQRSGSATAACDALNDVIIAREDYDLEARRQPSRQTRLARDLMAFARKQATCEIIALLDGRVADPQRGPPVLVALWNGGVAAGLARDTDEEGKPNLSVKIAGKWTRVHGDMEEGLRCLAEDPVAFAVAARKALDLEKKKSPPPDRLRSLRDLIANPTRRRFEALLEEVADGDGSRVETYLPALRQAARRLSGGRLTTAWRRQVAADADMIKAVAQGALQFLKPRIKTSGPPRDPAQDAYVTRLCEIYQGLTGEEVSYSTALALSRVPAGGQPFRTRLDFPPAGTAPHRSWRIGAPSAGVHRLVSLRKRQEKVRVAISGLSGELARRPYTSGA